MVGYGFGASFVALFMQLGGGIYTKAADVGADMVGKIEVILFSSYLFLLFPLCCININFMTYCFRLVFLKMIHVIQL